MSRESLLAMWLGPCLRLQQRSSIPAVFALAQFAHEGVRGDGQVSDLAVKSHNWAGIKYRSWIDQFGGRPVNMQTWEVLDGRRWDGQAAFAGFPDTGRFMAAYEHLLLTDRYRGALRFRSDPLMYAYGVWRAGWATDPAYLVGIARRIDQFDLLEAVQTVPANPQATLPASGGPARVEPV